MEVENIFKGYLSEGLHKFKWNGTNFSIGVYFYWLETGAFSLSRKMILEK
jgi:hypothetical protein